MALVARTSSELEETARQAEALGAATLTITTDVTDPAQVNQMVRDTIERFSNIEILVNNAGVPGRSGLFGTMMSPFSQ